MVLLMKVIRTAKDPCSICGQGRAGMLILSSMPNSEGLLGELADSSLMNGQEISMSRFQFEEKV